MAYIHQEPGDLLTNRQMIDFYEDAINLVALARSMSRKAHEVVEFVDRYGDSELMLPRTITMLGERAIEAVELVDRMLASYPPDTAGRHPAWYSALRDIDLELRDLAGHVVKLKTSQERHNGDKCRQDATLILGILTAVFSAFQKIRIGRRPIHTLSGLAIPPRRLREKSEPIKIPEQFYDE